MRQNPATTKFINEVMDLTPQEFADVLWDLSDAFRQQAQNTPHPVATKCAVQLSRLATDLIESLSPYNAYGQPTIQSRIQNQK